MKNYSFEVLEDLDAWDIARRLKACLVGKNAVCTSFDSALPAVQKEYAELARGQLPYALTEEVIEHWPASHENIYDEWWIFDGEVPRGFSVEALCNYNTTDFQSIEFAYPLSDYLEQFKPFAVFGNAVEFGYLIRRTTY